MKKNRYEAEAERANENLRKMREDLDSDWPDRLLEGMALHNPQLGPREKQVLQGFAVGMNSRMIADTFGTSEHTVIAQMKNIRIKLAAKTITQAACKAIRLGIIVGPPIELWENGGLRLIEGDLVDSTDQPSHGAA